MEKESMKGKLSLQTSPVGGRGRRINIPSSLLKYPIMKETDILEIVSLHLIQKQLKIPQYDDMKMLCDLFAKTSDVDAPCDVHDMEEANSECLLSGEKLFILNQQFDYIEFLKTLEEKECFVVIQHIPLDEMKDIEALITSFGEVVIFRDSLSINITEKIVLVKMGSVSECNWVTCCLDGHSWGDKVLSATKVIDICNDTVPKTRPPLKIRNCIEVKAKCNGQFENANLLKNDELPGKKVCQEISTNCNKPGKSLSCGSNKPGKSLSCGSNKPGKSLSCGSNKPGKSLSCGSESIVSALQNIDVSSTCSLSHENIFIMNGEYNYVEFLKTLDEKESFFVIEQIPLSVNESLENVVSKFGEITLFHIDMCRNKKGNIALVKMAKSSQCGSVITSLNGSSWGVNILKVRNLMDIISLS